MFWLYTDKLVMVEILGEIFFPKTICYIQVNFFWYIQMELI